MATAEERISEKWTALAGLAVNTYQAVQKTSELAELLTLLDREIKPRRVLEIGSDLGGSLYAWSQLPSVQRVYAVCLGPPTGYQADYHGATLIRGNSHDPQTLRQLIAVGGFEYDMVYIDGDHSEWGCRLDLILYGALAPFVVMHDIVIHPQFPDCHVYKVWDQLTQRSFLRYRNARFTQVVHQPASWGGYGLIRW